MRVYCQLINLVTFNDMVTFIIWVLVVATVAAFLLTLLKKWGVIEYVQVHGNDFFVKMFKSDPTPASISNILLYA